MYVPYQLTVALSLTLALLAGCGNPEEVQASDEAVNNLNMQNIVTRDLEDEPGASGGEDNFWPLNHAYMASRHLGPHPLCSMSLANGAIRQDLDQLSSEKHFDNCAFEAGMNYVQDQLNRTDGWVRKRNWWEAMRTLGQALHGIQDFYSHSNYVEQMATTYRIVPLWTDAGREQVLSMKSHGLVSGRYRQSDGAGPKIDPRDETCPAGVPTHDEMAKDTIWFKRGWAGTKWNMQGYYAAWYLADQASYEFLKYAFERWPYLRQECGRIISYPVMAPPF